MSNKSNQQKVGSMGSSYNKLIPLFGAKRCQECYQIMELILVLVIITNKIPT